MSDRDTLVRLNVAATELGLSSSTIKRYCKDGRLAGSRIGKGQWRVSRQSIEDLKNKTAHAYSRPTTAVVQPS